MLCLFIELTHLLMVLVMVRDSLEVRGDLGLPRLRESLHRLVVGEEVYEVFGQLLPFNILSIQLLLDSDELVPEETEDH